MNFLPLQNQTFTYSYWSINLHTVQRTFLCPHSTLPCNTNTFEEVWRSGETDLSSHHLSITKPKFYLLLVKHELAYRAENFPMLPLTPSLHYQWVPGGVTRQRVSKCIHPAVGSTQTDTNKRTWVNLPVLPWYSQFSLSLSSLSLFSRYNHVQGIYVKRRAIQVIIELLEEYRVKGKGNQVLLGEMEILLMLRKDN